ncbi:hypothetical protein E6R18_06540 [Streptomyces sp. A1277]|nr:hypothetical protein E6R18_06540 [Streptomyces sp. A1277]
MSGARWARSSSPARTPATSSGVVASRSEICTPGIRGSTRIPVLWTVAYGPDRPRPVRLFARSLLRVRAFARGLALADHLPSGGY